MTGSGDGATRARGLTRRGVQWLGALPLLMCCGWGGTARADEVPQLHPGAIEIGVSAAVTSVEGTQQVLISGRGGYFLGAGAGLIGVEAEVGYLHQLSLDRVDLGGQLSWQPRLDDRPYHPYVGFGAALRQEHLGSFSQTRYPLGLDLGLRTLLTRSVLVRTELRWRRVVGDPVANFNEVSFVAGVSLVARN